MSRWTGVLCGLAVGLAATGTAVGGGAAQERPDFSGVWALAPEDGDEGPRRGRRPGTPGSGWGPEFTIVQGPDSLMVERDFFSRGDLQRPLRYRFALDGSETRNSVLMGRGEQESTSTAAWEGDRLVLTTVRTASAPDTGAPVRSEVTRTLWLEPAGAGGPPTLVIETVRSGVMGGPPSTTRTEYTGG